MGHRSLVDCLIFPLVGSGLSGKDCLNRFLHNYGLQTSNPFARRG